MKNVVKDQEHFFNINSEAKKPEIKKDFFYYNYTNIEQFDGLNWLSDCKNILEYGCGYGTSLDIFFANRSQDDYKMFGVDIAQSAIDKIKLAYPKHNFYKISDNKMPDIEDSSIDGAYMLHVLHHSKGHEDMFREIYRTLKPDGKYFLSDLTSANPFIRFGRFMFSILSPIIKHKFEEDLVVDGKIPDKYKIDITETVKTMESVGFKIEKIGYGHLFFFLFSWFDKFVPISKYSLVQSFYRKLIQFEKYLLRYEFFQNNAEVLYIYARK